MVASERRVDTCASPRRAGAVGPHSEPAHPSLIQRGQDPDRHTLTAAAQRAESTHRNLRSPAYAKDFKKITDEVLAHLAATPGATLKVTIEIEAVNKAGFDESKVRAVSENAKTLRFDQSGFEEN